MWPNASRRLLPCISAQDKSGVLNEEQLGKLFEHETGGFTPSAEDIQMALKGNSTGVDVNGDGKIDTTGIAKDKAVAVVTNYKVPGRGCGRRRSRPSRAAPRRAVLCCADLSTCLSLTLRLPASGVAGGAHLTSSSLSADTDEIGRRRTSRTRTRSTASWPNSTKIRAASSSAN